MEPKAGSEYVLELWLGQSLVRRSLGPRTGCKTDFGPRAFSGGSNSLLSLTYPTRSGGSGSG